MVTNSRFKILIELDFARAYIKFNQATNFKPAFIKLQGEFSLSIIYNRFRSYLTPKRFKFLLEIDAANDEGFNLDTISRFPFVPLLQSAIFREKKNVCVG